MRLRGAAIKRSWFSRRGVSRLVVQSSPVQRAWQRHRRGSEAFRCVVESGRWPRSGRRCDRVVGWRCWSRRCRDTASARGTLAHGWCFPPAHPSDGKPDPFLNVAAAPPPRSVPQRMSRLPRGQRCRPLSSRALWTGRCQQPSRPGPCRSGLRRRGDLQPMSGPFTPSTPTLPTPGPRPGGVARWCRRSPPRRQRSGTANVDQDFTRCRWVAGGGVVA